MTLSVSLSNEQSVSSAAEHPTNADDELVQLACKVIECEIEALQELRASLDLNFARAVRLICNCSGRVVYTGLGKSGFIARKAAATLTSLGTPSFYLHAADALHGDIGALRSDDVLTVLSHSGTTDEIDALARVAHRFGASIIAITGRQDSPLAKLADVSLHVPVDKEACHLGLAPTSSTTAQLATTDALAIVVSKIKNHSAEDFARFHPAGALGKSLLLRVDDLMHSGAANAVVHESVSMADAIVTMTEKALGAVIAVNDDGRLVGIVTDGDLRRAIQRNGGALLALSVKQIMTKAPIVARLGARAVEALTSMESGDRLIGVLPVVDTAHRPIGLVRLHDLLRSGLRLPADIVARRQQASRG